MVRYYVYYRGKKKIISFVEEPDVIKQILQHLSLWEVRNTGPPCLPRRSRRRKAPAPRLNMVREPTYQPVRDHAPAGDEVWSQVPNYGYWAE
jgi:hypothetical protein